MNSLSYILYRTYFYMWKVGYFLSLLYNKVKFKILLGKNCGHKFEVAGTLNLHLRSKRSLLTIGNNFHSLNGNFYNPLSRNSNGAIMVEEDGMLIIGNGVGMSSVMIRAHSCIRICDNVNIGADTMILDTDCHSLNYLDRRTRGEEDVSNVLSSEILIEDDVFIGARTIITKGVHIGARSIIGAGSVVTKSIPPDCVAGGNPCKIIKYLTNEDKS